MQALAEYILRGRFQAALVVVLAELLSFTGVLFPLSLISGAALALVTLRTGVVQGLTVLAYGMLAMVAVSLLTIHNATALLVMVLPIWLPALVLAEVLRRTISLSATISIGALLALLGVVLTYLLIGDPAPFWTDMIHQWLKAYGMDNLLADSSAVAFIGQLSRYMTGLLATGLLFNTVFALSIARWWQAKLFNPGGFRQEFHEFRVTRWFVWLTLVVLVLSFLPLSESAPLLEHMVGELWLLVFTLYSIQGVAIAHRLVAIYKANVVWLVLFYILMFFTPLSQLVAIIGLVDNWLDIRTRFAKAKG